MNWKTFEQTEFRKKNNILNVYDSRFWITPRDKKHRNTASLSLFFYIFTFLHGDGKMSATFCQIELIYIFIVKMGLHVTTSTVSSPLIRFPMKFIRMKIRVKNEKNEEKNMYNRLPDVCRFVNAIEWLLVMWPIYFKIYIYIFVSKLPCNNKFTSDRYDKKKCLPSK